MTSDGDFSPPVTIQYSGNRKIAANSGISNPSTIQ